jgi:hypothetical protein
MAFIPCRTPIDLESSRYDLSDFEWRVIMLRLPETA